MSIVPVVTDLFVMRKSFTTKAFVAKCADWLQNRLAAAVLHRPLPVPIPFSEREPGPEDMKAGRVWACCQQLDLRELDIHVWKWRMTIAELHDLDPAHIYTHWLPASTKFLPTNVNE